MGLFNFGKKEEKKEIPSEKSAEETFKLTPSGLIFEAKLQFLTNSKTYAKEIAENSIKHIEQSVDLKQRKRYYLLSSKINPIKKVSKKDMVDVDKNEKLKDIYNASVDLRIGVMNKLNLFDFCFNYLPFFIEVIEPMNINFTAHDLTEYATNIQATIHNIDEKLKANSLAYQTLLQKHNILATNMGRLLRNMILMILKEKQKDIKELSKAIGIPEDQLRPFIENMEKDNEIKLNKNKYGVVK